MDPCRYLEELEPQRRGLCPSQISSAKGMMKEVHQVIGQTVQLQAKGIGSIARATEPVGLQAIFQLVNPILNLSPTLVEDEQFGGAPVPVGDHAAHIRTQGIDLHLDQNPASPGPSAGSITEAGEDPHRLARIGESLLSPLQQRS